MDYRERQLYDIVSTYEKSYYPFFVQEAEDDFLLYQLSKVRGNAVRGVGIEAGASVLEYGAEYGAVTGTLLEMGCRVVSVVKTEAQEEILRARIRSDYSRVESNHRVINEAVASTSDCIEMGDNCYNYVVISDLSAQDRFAVSDILLFAKNRIKPGGRIIMAFDNKYGLKNFAGERERFSGNFFAALEGYVGHKGDRMFSLQEITKAVEESNLTIREIYYPYPDHRLCFSLYSQQYMPKAGELNRNLANYWKDRLLCFDESRAYDTIVQDGLFHIFSNSYLLVIEGM